MGCICVVTIIKPDGRFLYVDGLVSAAIMLGGMIAIVILPTFLPRNLVGVVPLMFVILVFAPALKAKQKKDAILRSQQGRL